MHFNLAQSSLRFYKNNVEMGRKGSSFSKDDIFSAMAN